MILVTGSRGFIGRALISALEEQGYEPTGLDVEHGSIEDPRYFESVVDHDISHVFHLAAKAYVPDSWVHPDSFMRTNVIGTGNVLEFCRTHNATLTHISAYLYGVPSVLPIKEDAPVKPNNPYALSKHLAEQLCRFYRDEFGVKVNIIRPFNVYGPGQDRRFLIPTIVEQVVHADAVRLKSLTPRRDYVFIDDLVEALIKAMIHGDRNSTYNIAAGYSLSVKEVTETILSVFNVQKNVYSEHTDRKNEIDDVVGDIEKARRELDWTPRHGFREGIERFVARSSDG